MFLVDGTYEVSVLPYSLLFAIFFAMGNFGIINAIKTGSVMLSSLFNQLALIVTSIWGFFFWNEKFTLLSGVGLALTVIAICLCLMNGKGEKAKLSLRWIIYVLLSFAGNAGCSIVQRTQQMSFGGKYGNFLMVVATGLSIIMFVIVYLRSDRSDSGELVRTSWYYPVIAGVLNALLNLFVILMATSSLSSSLIYPTIAVGSLALVMIFSLFIMKEKMRRFWLIYLR
jgi:drug/metabolite transporter (DMT)-like permease